MNIQHIINIILSELSFDFARSSGAGGQNVNKVNSKAILKWNLWASAIPYETQSILYSKLSSKISGEGNLVVDSERFRDQPANRKDCVEKIKVLLERALHISKPRKVTKPTRSSKLKRLEGKKRAKETKRNRAKVRL